MEDFDLRGMNNLYNSARFAAGARCVNITDLTYWQNYYDIDNYIFYWSPMQYLVQDYLLGGYNQTVKASDMLFGY